MMRRLHDLLCVSLTLAAAALALPSLAADEQTEIIDFESEEWTISAGRTVDHLGRKALAGSASLVSDFNGLLLRVTVTGEREVLIDTRDAGISLTDFGYAPDHKLVVIPTLRGNSLLAFTLN
jgi:hypothetical protein